MTLPLWESDGRGRGPIASRPSAWPRTAATVRLDVDRRGRSRGAGRARPFARGRTAAWQYAPATADVAVVARGRSTGRGLDGRDRPVAASAVPAAPRSAGRPVGHTATRPDGRGRPGQAQKPSSSPLPLESSTLPNSLASSPSLPSSTSSARGLFRVGTISTCCL